MIDITKKDYDAIVEMVDPEDIYQHGALQATGLEHLPYEHKKKGILRDAFVYLREHEICNPLKSFRIGDLAKAIVLTHFKKYIDADFMGTDEEE